MHTYLSSYSLYKNVRINVRCDTMYHKFSMRKVCVKTSNIYLYESTSYWLVLLHIVLHIFANNNSHSLAIWVVFKIAALTEQTLNQVQTLVQKVKHGN